MSTSFNIFDPLPASILGAHKEGHPEVLAHARMTFGQAREIYALTEHLKDRSKGSDLAVLDLTCVQSLGDALKFAPLRQLADQRATAVVVRRALAAKYNRLFEPGPFATIIIGSEDDGKGIMEEVRCPSGGKDFEALLGSAGFLVDAPYRDLYIRSREVWLTDLVKASLRAPPPGKRYHLLGDGTRANYWLDVKQVVGHTEIGFEIGYHIAREISHDFSRRCENTTLVVGNNTASVLATHVRLVLGPTVSVSVFDRLGPFAYLAKARLDAIAPMNDNAIIIEDVISTGREVDLIALLALVSGREIKAVYTVYHLDIAEPLLVPRKIVQALARPAKSLNYLRRPAVSSDENGEDTSHA